MNRSSLLGGSKLYGVPGRQILGSDQNSLDQEHYKPSTIKPSSKLNTSLVKFTWIIAQKI